MDSANFEKISQANSAKEAWDIIDKAYAGADKAKKVRLQSLHREYENMNMEEQESVVAYFTRFQTLVNLMKTCGEVFIEQTLVEKVLRSLTSRFDYTVVAIEESKNLAELRLDDLQSSIEAHDQIINARNKDNICRLFRHNHPESMKGIMETRTRRGSGNLISGRVLVRVKAATQVRIMKATRRKVKKKGSLLRRSLIKRGFNVIIAKSEAILPISVKGRRCQEMMMRLDWHMRRVQARILNKSF